MNDIIKINLPLTDRCGNKIGTAEVDLENNTVTGQINIDGVMGMLVVDAIKKAREDMIHDITVCLDVANCYI